MARYRIDISFNDDTGLFTGVMDSDIYLSAEEPTLSALLEELASQAASEEADQIRAHVADDDSGYASVTFRR